MSDLAAYCGLRQGTVRSTMSPARAAGAARAPVSRMSVLATITPGPEAAATRVATSRARSREVLGTGEEEEKDGT